MTIIAPILFVLLGAFIAWYGVYLGRTNKSPLPPISFLQPRANGAAPATEKPKHQESIHVRGM